MSTRNISKYAFIAEFFFSTGTIDKQYVLEGKEFSLTINSLGKLIAVKIGVLQGCNQSLRDWGAMAFD
jgi:hypothetical protein